MEVITLGTGSPLPDPNRAGAATLVRAGSATLLFDCGRGVLLRAAAVGVVPPLLTQVFLTHLHSDHVNDFNDVLTTRWVMSPVDSPLPVIGPAGTSRFVERTIAMLEDDIGWRIEHHDDLTWQPSCDVREVSDGVVWESADGVRVFAAPTAHKPVHPTVGYRVEHDGAAVALAGDTVPCDGLTQLCAGADVYVQTVVRPDLVAQIPAPRLQDILDYHSSCEDAGRTAAAGGVGTLVLTHPVPPPAPGTDGEWIAQAAAHFDGEIILAADLTTISI
jgi:ribonuclease Z